MNRLFGTRRLIFYLMLLGLLVSSFGLNAQKGITNNGAKIVVSSNSIIKLTGSDHDITNKTFMGIDGTIDLDGKIYLEGDWYNNAAGGNVLINRNSDGEVIFNGLLSQKIGGSRASAFEILRLNNAQGLTLSNSIDINTNFNLIDGNILLNTSDLVMQSAAIFSGSFGSGEMIVTNSTGGVKLIVDGLTNKLIPIGDNVSTLEYSPLEFTLDAHNGLSSAYVHMRVTDAQHPNDNSPYEYLTRYWTLESVGITDPDYTLDLHYLNSDVVGPEENIYGVKYTGASRRLFNKVVPASNMITFANLSSFSEFTGADGTSPSVEVTSTVDSLDNVSPIPLTISFNEVVENFIETDISISSGTLNGFGTANNKDFTVNLTPTGDGPINISIASDVANDQAGNNNVASSLLSLSYDGTQPTVTLSTNVTNPTKTSPFTVIAEFSEEVYNFISGDISVVNGNVSNFQSLVANKKWSFDITPTTNTNVSIAINADVANDAAGNLNSASNQLQIRHDNVSPGATFSASVSDSTNLNPFTLRLTFDEPVIDFTLSDLSLDNATADNFTPTAGGEIWDIDIRPITAGNLTIDLAAGVATDSALNENTAASQFAIVYDDIAPTISISTTEPDTTNATIINFTIEFSEEVNGFDVSDIVVVGGTKGALSTVTANKKWTLPITTGGDGAITVNIAADIASDPAGNPNTAADEYSIVSDQTNPSVISFTPPDENDKVAINDNLVIEFDEVVNKGTGNVTIYNSGGTIFEQISIASSKVTGFGTKFITIDPASDFVSEASYYVQIDGTAIFDNATNTYAGIADNTTWNFTIIDATFPYLISKTPLDDAIDVVLSSNLGLEFSETINKNALGGFIKLYKSDHSLDKTIDILSADVSISSALVTINPSTDLADETEYYVLVDDTAFIDDQSNYYPGISSPTSWNFTTEDTTKATVLTYYPNNGAIDVDTATSLVLTFSEDVFKNTGSVRLYNASDDLIETVDVNSANVTVSSDQVTIDLTKSLIGQTTYYVLVDAGTFKDKAGNLTDGILNKTAWSFETEDVVRPTVTLSSLTHTNESTFDVTVTFSEAVDPSSFTTTDIIVTNGGVCENLTTSDNTIFTATVGQYNDGIVQINILEGAALDLGGNLSLSSNVIEVDHDGTAPTVTISSSESVITNLSAIPVTITFSEEVQDFLSTDVSITNGTISDFASIDDIEFTMNINPTSNGTVEVSVASSVAQDLSGNYNEMSNIFSIEYDGQSPTPSITSAVSSPTNVSPIVVNVSFDEDVSGFDLTDLVIANGTGSAIRQLTTSSWEVEITAIGDGIITVDLAADKVQDGAGNGNITANQFSIEFDTDGPSMNITSTESPRTNLSSIPVVITFDEAIDGFNLTDITVTNGVASNFTEVITDTQWSITVTPNSEGSVVVDIPAGAVMDKATNINASAGSLSILYDATKPDVVVSSSISGITNQPSVPVSIVFSEGVEGFNTGMITLVNATVSGFTEEVLGREWSLDLIPISDGIVGISIAAGVVPDSAGNTCTASNVYSVTYDGTSPTLSIHCSEPNPTTSSTFEVAFQFSESVNGFVIDDINVVNATLANFINVDGAQYTVDVSPIDDGTVSVGVDAGIAQDAAGNINSAASPYITVYDSSAPELSITSPISGLTNESVIPVTFTFTEEVVGFDISDINTTNCIITGLTATKASTYTASITPSSDGELSIEVPIASFSDLAGNDNTESVSYGITFDGTKPGVTLSSASATVTEASIKVDIAFTEPVTGFESSDISITNAIVSSLFSSDNQNYEFIVTASAAGNVTFNIAAEVVQDLAGNTNTAASELIVNYNPTVDIDDVLLESISVYEELNKVIVILPEDLYSQMSNAQISIYSIDGRLILRDRLSSVEKQKFELEDAEQIFIVKLNIDGAQYSTKLFLHR